MVHDMYSSVGGEVKVGVVNRAPLVLFAFLFQHQQQQLRSALLPVAAS